jgi:hypothetical protein
MNLDYSEVFSSKAQTKLLLVLASMEQPAHLRLLAELTQIPLFSVQRAVCWLHQRRFLVRSREKNRILYTLNRKRKESLGVVNILEEMLRQQRRDLATTVTKKAKAALRFADEVATVIPKRASP